MRRIKLNKFLSVLMLIVFITSVFPVIPVSAASRTAQIYDYENTVKVKRGKTTLNAYKNMRLKEGDTITTGEDSYAYIDIDGDKVIKMDESTVITISNLSGSASDGNTNISLSSGKIFNDIKKKLTQNSTYNIRTSQSVMGVRGTKFIVDVRVMKNGVGETSVTVLDGIVIIAPAKSPGESVPVGANQKSSVTDETQHQKPITQYINPSYMSVFDLKVIENDPILKEKIEALLEKSGTTLEEVVKKAQQQEEQQKKEQKNSLIKETQEELAEEARIAELNKTTSSGTERYSPGSTQTPTPSSEGNANLNSIAYNCGTLSPQFSSSTVEYELKLKADVNTVTLNPMCAVSGASIVVKDGSSVQAYNADANGYMIDISSVSQKDVYVEVTAKDGNTKKTYHITLKKYIEFTQEPSINTTSTAMSNGKVIISQNSTDALHIDFASSIGYSSTISYLAVKSVTNGSPTQAPTVQQLLDAAQNNQTSYGGIAITCKGSAGLYPGFLFSVPVMLFTKDTGYDMYLVLSYNGVNSVMKKLTFETCNIPSPTGFAGGSGTSEDPYRVATPNHLNNVRNHLDAYFIQVSDIDFGVDDDFDTNSDSNFQPIGATSEACFKGYYNGNGHKISGINIITDGDYAGLFGYQGGTSTIENIQIESGSVTGRNSKYIGGIVGYNSTQASIMNCYNSADIGAVGESTEVNIGGIVGWVYQQVESCTNAGVVLIESTNTQSINIGGIAGINGGSVFNCSNTGTVSGTAITSGTTINIGGIAGSNAYKGHTDSMNGFIKDCSNLGTINGGASDGRVNLGGVAGENLTQISECYNTGYINGEFKTVGENTIGGIVGYQYKYPSYNTPPIPSLANSYNTGDVCVVNNIDNFEKIGGIAGFQDSWGNFEACYNVGKVTYINSDHMIVYGMGIAGVNTSDSSPYFCYSIIRPLSYETDRYVATNQITNLVNSSEFPSSIWINGNSEYIYPQLINNLHKVNTTKATLNDLKISAELLKDQTTSSAVIMDNSVVDARFKYGTGTTYYGFLDSREIKKVKITTDSSAVVSARGIANGEFVSIDYSIQSGELSLNPDINYELIVVTIDIGSSDMNNLNQYTIVLKQLAT